MAQGVKRASIPADQKTFRHNYNLGLEFFATSLFGQKYYKSVDRVDIGFWKAFYVAALEVLQAFVLSSAGSMDKEHRREIEHHLKRTYDGVKGANAKDELHGALILGLFKLVFLLSGRLPYSTKGKRRNLSTFRTLNYCQTDEQLSYLLEGHIRRHYKDHGFAEPFEAGLAFQHWCKEQRRQTSDRVAYVDWVLATFPATFAEYR